MAPRAKVAAAKKTGGRKRNGHAGNDVSAERLQQVFDKIHNLTDDMEESNAATRGEIGRVYEEAAQKLDMTKSALKFIFRLQRQDRKGAAQAAQMDGRERQSLLRASEAFGSDSPFGNWLAAIASQIPEESAEVE